METIEPLLAEHPIFEGLDPKYISLMVGCASNVRFNAGEFIIRDGDTDNVFYLIRHGSVALDVYSPTKGSITFLTLGPGEVMGWEWLVPPYQTHGDARAVELVRAVKINAECLREKFAQDHELELELLKRFVPLITERVKALTMQLLDVYAPQTPKLGL
ncbi:MAG: cyclic nucleotide-binding domain-containing protein [Calditrichota bacterium]